MILQKVEIEMNDTKLGRKAIQGIQHEMQAILHMTPKKRKQLVNEMDIPEPSTNPTRNDN